MQCIDIKQLKPYVKPDAERAKMKFDNTDCTVHFAYQKTGSGGKKRFFRCPYCNKRYQKMYWNGQRLACRKCNNAKPYTGIKNTTKGGTNEITYRMLKYAAENKIPLQMPFDYLNFVLDDRKGKESFRKSLKVLQALENMRFSTVFFRTTYKPDVIGAVIRGEHPLLLSCTLHDLKNNFYDWSSGKQIILSDQDAKKAVHQKTKNAD